MRARGRVRVCVCVRERGGGGGSDRVKEKSERVLVGLCLLLYCSFNFMDSLFYEPALTTTKVPLLG